MQFTRYTVENYQTLPSNPIDANNLTNHHRTLEDYSKIIKFNNQNIFNWLGELVASGKKIRVLDCGAGSGTALNDLLTGPYRDIIEKCVGISLHFFKNVPHLFHNHGDKIEWFLGPAEKILPTLTEEFDIVFDVFGAYHYSPERSLLIEQYHRLLKIGGIAGILTDIRTSNRITRGGNLEDYYTTNFPNEFSFSKMKDNGLLNIHKQNEEIPGIKFTLTKVRSCHGTLINNNGYSVYELKKGNAWRPHVVYFKPQGAIKKSQNEQKKKLIMKLADNIL